MLYVDIYKDVFVPLVSDDILGAYEKYITRIHLNPDSPESWFTWKPISIIGFPLYVNEIIKYILI